MRGFSPAGVHPRVGPAGDLGRPRRRRPTCFRPAEPKPLGRSGKLAARTVHGPLAGLPVQPADDSLPGEACSSSAGTGRGTRRACCSRAGGCWVQACSMRAVADLPAVLLPIALWSWSLGMAFRRASDVGWSLATIAFAGLGLTGADDLLGWKWNSQPDCASPPARHGGPFRHPRASRAAAPGRRPAGRAPFRGARPAAGGIHHRRRIRLARVLLQCRDGQPRLVPAPGIALALVTAVYLLPAWWSCAAPRGRGTTSTATSRFRSGVHEAPVTPRETGGWGAGSSDRRVQVPPPVFRIPAGCRVGGWGSMSAAARRGRRRRPGESGRRPDGRRG